MKIDNTLASIGASNSNDMKVRHPSNGSNKVSTADTSKIELSRHGQIESALANTSEVNTAKVNEIKQAITDGQFKVNPEKVADALIDSVKQMLQAQPQKA
ncbi:MAG: flagellar biosynthesis anti-sigma factor FlgM [Betaproteobacteria bacterium]|nr:flagellar biosynthesis anti-sigma factor FlgM [Betaproteobacteria bacterium]